MSEDKEPYGGKAPVESERDEGMEAAAKIAEGGAYIHPESPEAKFGRSIAAAIRRAKGKPVAVMDSRVQLRAVLGSVLDFLELRDRMNAAMHLGEVKWSPLTEMVQAALGKGRIQV